MRKYDRVWVKKKCREQNSNNKTGKLPRIRAFKVLFECKQSCSRLINLEYEWYMSVDAEHPTIWNMLHFVLPFGFDGNDL